MRKEKESEMVKSVKKPFMEKALRALEVCADVAMVVLGTYVVAESVKRKKTIPCVLIPVGHVTREDDETEPTGKVEELVNLNKSKRKGSKIS